MFYFQYTNHYKIVNTLVHLHHYCHLGLEIFHVLKKAAPQAKLFLTLHEYLGICAHLGQMVKKDDFQLCSAASFEECSRCISDKSPEDFWLRKHLFDAAFRHVDVFIAPSHFLKQRYIQWGIADTAIHVIENGQDSFEKLPPRLLEKGETRNRFGFFGQINPFKGLPVLLEALASLPGPIRKHISLEVHGANLALQHTNFSEQIERLLVPLTREGIVHWIGPYRRKELRSRLSMVDWVIVPSIWWENSPMVIQGAFVHGRPVLVSDIGGMAEKVKNGIEGIHIRTGSTAAWAEAFARTSRYTDEWMALYQALPTPLSHEECMEKHLALYEQ